MENLGLKISEFFDYVEDTINDSIDRIELTPIQISNTSYICGLRRSQYSLIDVDIHIKEIRRIKLLETNKENDGWWMLEPDGEMWINSTLLNEKILENAFTKFKENFNKLNTYHILTSKWKDQKTNLTCYETTLFENKRVACKDALKLRKIHKDVTNKFNMYYLNENGEVMEVNKTKEPSDFELVTCKVE